MKRKILFLLFLLTLSKLFAQYDFMHTGWHWTHLAYINLPSFRFSAPNRVYFYQEGIWIVSKSGIYHIAHEYDVPFISGNL